MRDMIARIRQSRGLVAVRRHVASNHIGTGTCCSGLARCDDRVVADTLAG
jgi:hypothetical protein